MQIAGSDPNIPMILCRVQMQMTIVFWCGYLKSLLRNTQLLLKNSYFCN